MYFNKPFLKNIALAAAVLSVTFVSGAAIGQRAKFAPFGQAEAQIQNQGEPAYEQQSINAVRSIKSAVVDIVGNSTSKSQDGDITTIGGTGFIIDANGLIVSNSHVVQDSNISYTVVLGDGSQHDAKVVGLDKYNDVALLKIDTTGLPVAKLGSSDNMETGQTVFAVGNSLGKYQNTVTKGVISGLGRSVDVSSDSDQPTQPRLQNMIQTDAAINPGNSGGPLIDLNGEVIGMNTLIDTGGEGLGFAVNINTVKSSVDQLQRFGKVSKPYVGIKFMTIDKAVQVLKGLNASNGAYVDGVTSGSPADKAGIKSGDIIIQINHEQLTQNNQLDQIISKYQAGNQVLITLIRDGKQEDMPLILGQFEQ